MTTPAVTKLLLGSMYGKFGERPSGPTLRVVLSDRDKVAYFSGRYGKVTVTPEGHVFIRQYRKKTYRCLCCDLLKQTARGRAEYFARKNGLLFPASAEDVRWTTELPKCKPFVREVFRGSDA